MDYCNFQSQQKLKLQPTYAPHVQSTQSKKPTVWKTRWRRNSGAILIVYWSMSVLIYQYSSTP